MTLGRVACFCLNSSSLLARFAFFNARDLRRASEILERIAEVWKLDELDDATFATLHAVEDENAIKSEPKALTSRKHARPKHTRN